MYLRSRHSCRWVYPLLTSVQSAINPSALPIRLSQRRITGPVIDPEGFPPYPPPAWGGGACNYLRHCRPCFWESDCCSEGGRSLGRMSYAIREAKLRTGGGAGGAGEWRGGSHVFYKE
jgi:hypothetical protein